MGEQPTNQNTNNSHSAQENFDTSIYIQKSIYDAEMDELRKRVEKVEGKVKDHTALADTFKDAFEHSKDMDTVLSQAIIKLLSDDKDVKTAFNGAVKNADREWWQKHWKKAVTVVGAIILLGIGAIFNAASNRVIDNNDQPSKSSQTSR